MKKNYLMLSAALLLAGAAHAQGTELFFSEYNEGAHQMGVNYGGTANSTGNERALEIFNPTNNTVNLNPYSVRRYSNGDTFIFQEEKVFRKNATLTTNSLSARTTFVIACGEATLPAIVNSANQFCAPYAQAPAATNTVIIGGGPIYFSGDDAMALVRYPSGIAGDASSGPGVIVDLIGVIGERPLLQSCATGGNWSGTNPLDGTGSNAVFVASANQSITRRATVQRGVRTSPAPQNVIPATCPPTRAAGGYNIADEWYMYSTAFNGPGGASNAAGQLYDRLGNHNDYLGPYGTYQAVLSTLSKFDSNISVYPNPAHGTATVEIKDAKVGSVTVLNNLGQRISAEAKGQGQEKLQLNISALKPGLYFVQILSADGQTKIYKELVVE